MGTDIKMLCDIINIAEKTDALLYAEENKRYEEYIASYGTPLETMYHSLYQVTVHSRNAVQSLHCELSRGLSHRITNFDWESICDSMLEGLAGNEYVYKQIYAILEKANYFFFH